MLDSEIFCEFLVLVSGQPQWILDGPKGDCNYNLNFCLIWGANGTSHVEKAHTNSYENSMFIREQIRPNLARPQTCGQELYCIFFGWTV